MNILSSIKNKVDNKTKNELGKSTQGKICTHNSKHIAKCYKDYIDSCAKCYGGIKPYSYEMVTIRKGTVLDMVGYNATNLIVTVECKYKHDPFEIKYRNLKAGTDYHWCRKCKPVTLKQPEDWTYERVMREIKEKKLYLHFNYDKVTEYSINKGKYSKFYVTCLNCDNEYETGIVSNIVQQTSCKKCSGYERWNYKLFMETVNSNEFYDRFDYSLIKKEDIKDKESKIKIICKDCNTKWEPTIHNHINSKSGCPGCNSSKRELYTRISLLDITEELKDVFPKILRNFNIKEQVSVPQNPKQRFDFTLNFEAFIDNKWQNKNIHIELDGEQHFDLSVRNRVFKNSVRFDVQYDRDKQKENACFENNDTLIRTHQINNHYGTIPNLDILIKYAISNILLKYTVFINIREDIVEQALTGNSAKHKHSDIYDIFVYFKGDLNEYTTLDSIIEDYKDGRFWPNLWGYK